MSHIVKSLYVEIRRDEYDALRARVAELEQQKAFWFEGARMLGEKCDQLESKQPSAGVAQGIDIDAAAKALAQCMDYPWDFMPVQGRKAMYEHAKSVIGAARLNVSAVAVPADHSAQTLNMVPDGYLMVPIDRSYDMRAAAILHYNTAKQEGKDHDDALNAAWLATLAKSHAPDGVATSAPAQQKEADA